MTPIFHFRHPKTPFEDPYLFVRIVRERRAIQFDLGEVTGLSPSELYRITDVFVTHMHMDHFVGFDALLRVVLRRETPLNIYGPPNITACVAGKLRGYDWNLIRDYPLEINVFSYNGRDILHSAFRAKNRFRRETAERSASDGTLLAGPLFRVRAAKLSHGIPCLAFALEEGYHINIDKDRLLRKGLEVGPWLAEFKKMVREEAPADSIIRISGRSRRMKELSDIATITKGQKICYASDIAMAPKNMATLAVLAEGSDLFFCEAYYADKDGELARDRFHLTAKACGSIARRAGAKKLIITHISPKYSGSPEQVVKEVMDEFRGREAL